MKKLKSTIGLMLFLSFVLLAFSMRLTGAVDDSWETLEPMPTESAWVGVVVVDGKIYVMVDELNYEYNPSTDSWITKTSMPTPRSSFGIAVVENKIYAIGGSTDAYVYTDVNEVYDPVTDTWETRTSMPTKRSKLSANVVDGKIYLIGGGQRTPNDNFDMTEVYDPTTDSWTTKTPVPTRVSYYVSAVVDRKIYVIGGNTRNTVGVNLTQVYDPEADAWSSGSALLTGVDSAAAGVTAGTTGTQRIFVLGGKQGLDAVNLNQVYDPQTDTWVYGPAMPTARYSLGVAVVNDSLYAFGGREGWIGSPVSAANERYTPADFVPEFSSWAVAPLFMTVTLVAITVYKRRLTKKQNH